MNHAETVAECYENAPYAPNAKAQSALCAYSVAGAPRSKYMPCALWPRFQKSRSQWLSQKEYSKNRFL